MPSVVTAFIVIAAVVNLLPLTGALSAGQLESLYGLSFEDPSLIVLMRHRAVLFGIVGGLLLVSARKVSLRPIAIPVGLVSMLSFILIAFLVGEYNESLQRVVLVDVVASFLLALAAVIPRITRVPTGRDGQ